MAAPWWQDMPGSDRGHAGEHLRDARQRSDARSEVAEMSPIKRHGVPLPRAEPTRSVPNASSFGHWMALFYPNVQHLVVAAYKPMTLDGGWKGHWGLHVVELTLAYGPCAADREGGLEDVPRVTKEDLDLIADRVQMDVTVEMFTGGEVWEWRRVP